MKLVELRAEVKSGAWRPEMDLRHLQTKAEFTTGKPTGCRKEEEARPRHWMAVAEEEGGGGWAEPAVTKTNCDWAEPVATKMSWDWAEPVAMKMTSD